jgi:uncharacterized membrane protein HdeD (DUF308 family)
VIGHRPHLMRPTRAVLFEYRRWVKALAVAFFAIGFALLVTAADGSAGRAVAALGWSLVAFGAAYAAAAFTVQGAEPRAAYAVCGSVILVDPVLGPLLLFVAVSFAFVVGGIVQAIAAVARRHAQSVPALVSGIAIAALGVAIAREWPLAPVPALAVAFGLAAAAQGAACLRLAAAGERLAQRNLFGLRKNPSTRQPSGERATWRLPPGRQT